MNERPTAENDAWVLLIQHLDPCYSSQSGPDVPGGYVRWVKCRCGWESEKSSRLVNAPDMRAVHGAHIAESLIAVGWTRPLPPGDSA